MDVHIPGEAKMLHKYIANQLSTMYEIQEAQNIAGILLHDLFEINQTHILVNKKVHISEDQKLLLQNALERLLEHEPIQYVTGKSYFFGNEFYVDQNVLIPRPETEELVSLITESATKNAKILDIGTGSGCIAISLSKKIPEASVSALDIDQNTLNVAQKNALQNGVNIQYILQDILSVSSLNDRFDIIVSNPPYVLPSDKELMRDNVKMYEPVKALFIPENDSLLFYRKIAELAFHSLNKNGLLFFEIHEKMGVQIKLLLQEIGFNRITIHKDMQGKDRMARAEIK